tara:strand:+ start:2293 stop:3192 length:900 start_codon:yes stop_codon:yes gene_type:complete
MIKKNNKINFHNFIKSIKLDKKNVTNGPLVSVIMPSFNQYKFVEKSILSIINQNYSNLELIIIDAGSTDGTISIIKKYEQYIKYWISEKDQGQSDALNKGFKVSKGEILCWLNSDDLLLPNSINNVVNTLEKNQDKNICFGDWITIDENDHLIDEFFAFDFNLNHFIYEGFHLNSQALFWRRNVLNQFSGFDLSLHKTMDYQMILEFGLNNSNNKFIRIDHSLAAFRRYSGQKTAGYEEDVHLEHVYISKKYGINDKFSYIGRLKRFYFRIRRAKWYLKRGGIRELIKRLLFMRINYRK